MNKRMKERKIERIFLGRNAKVINLRRRTFGVKPVRRFRTELNEVGEFLFEVEPTVDLRFIGYELVSLLQLMTTHDADETRHVVDVAHRSHHEFVRQYCLIAPAAPHSVQPAIHELC